MNVHAPTSAPSEPQLVELVHGIAVTAVECHTPVEGLVRPLSTEVWQVKGESPKVVGTVLAGRLKRIRSNIVNLENVASALCSRSAAMPQAWCHACCGCSRPSKHMYTYAASSEDMCPSPELGNNTVAAALSCLGATDADFDVRNLRGSALPPSNTHIHPEFHLVLSKKCARIGTEGNRALHMHCMHI